MRLNPHVVYRAQTPNYSLREGAVPSLITVHSTEGRNIPASTSDLIGVSKYLCQPATDASCHVVTDGDGNSTRICADKLKAWHCAGFNRVSLGIEQVGQAAIEKWLRAEYEETARWIALFSKRFGIPIQHGAVSGFTVTRHGVIRHSELGAAGGDHADPGFRYDLDLCLQLARYVRRRI